MPLSPLVTRTALVLAAFVLVGSVSGCRMFGKKDDLYTASVEARPLEVPPDLDRPSADRAMALPSGGVATASSVATPGGTAPIGFNAPGDRDALYARVGEVLATIPGVSIASRAQLLGTYDVSYMGANFLVRVATAGDGSYISAVDPRGLPPPGEAPLRVIGALKAAIAP